jgi:23S rRNA (cytosine1962-C5)-methyltransferase
MYPTIRLKAGRPGSHLSRHPWVFSGAIDRTETLPDHGEIVTVLTHDGELVGTGTWSAASMIAVRLFSFEECEIDPVWLTARIREADRRRTMLGFGPDTDTTAYRVVYGESDWLPGLVVDRYGDCLVLQIATAGAERLKANILSALTEIFSPQVILERSDLATRSEENLEPVVQLHMGDAPGLISFRERGRMCLADIMSGQKTGFFLDQRDLRDLVHRLASGDRGLDLFSYTGATTIAALIGGVKQMTCVDASEAALELCLRHAEANHLDSERICLAKADVFQWLSEREEPAYDLVLLDPPALIKSRKHIEHGRKGYHFLNRAALRLVKDGGLFFTSSCSSYFGEDDMLITLRRAADQAGVRLQLLATVRQSGDHPLSLYFPESGYLKSFVCQVNRQ